VDSNAPMARFIKDGASLDTARRLPDDAGDLAARVRSEMQSAVGSVRARLPEAFPRWQQRRHDAADAATTDRQH
jgi:ElaB/YqjD/DUF883 family membrane-anchored ribosome-binding protein